MTSFPADLLLLAALLATTVCVVMVHRKLKRLDVLNADYERALADTSRALIAARDALVTLDLDGKETLILLATRIDQAHALIDEIDRRDAGQVPASKSVRPPSGDARRR
ncbi:MAG: hypothetical protein B7Y12_24540 [Rhizobiales bacterium 24-66-13]|jgi:hypothetical protein|uniref:hypothetical protein n=1 Tax=Roseixanthobacter finlandensis TaxID=3119922 RepID=UPI000BCCF096|nr:MAG: hypothetical protein B7Z45_00230 [Azorhizobium sp. 12-66-6]OYY81766.1 MAG: hypothetical protein B7Y61_13080 [Rhizobiales bacterium 35-66-30]OYZ65004.1 MAG: hypothetical protein B7Y12_24540 [Rhizobiales bacterium 24-66-13]OZB00432.1 MAG: hypothetical protein B7X67_20880 [Rhizobiales bacterium 39-66-18]HQS09380.1 hypothetical protein [Xanthobacteraceae bacterium]